MKFFSFFHKLARVGAVIFFILCLGYTTHLTYCDEVTIGCGDHLEMVFQDDGLVRCVHTILATSNDTVNVTFSGTYSFIGNLIGNVTYEVSPEIQWHEVWFGNQSSNSAEIIVNYNTTVRPLKFTSITLKYMVAGLLTESNGTWHFRQSFNIPKPHTMEVIAKIPKPKFPWDNVETENVVPSPEVFLEETGYYVLVWRTPLFSTEENQIVYVELTYRTVPNTSYWSALIITSVISAIVGIAIGYLLRSKKANSNIIKQKTESTEVCN